MESAYPRFVIDTNALFWFLFHSTRLGDGAREAFARIKSEQATGLVPAIVVAELTYLFMKRNDSRTAASVLSLIDRAPSLRFEPVTRAHVLAFDRLGDIPEMHDRFIAAVGLVHDAPIVTRDATIRASRAVRSVWD